MDHRPERLETGCPTTASGGAEKFQSDPISVIVCCSMNIFVVVMAPRLTRLIENFGHLDAKTFLESGRAAVFRCE
jgi:hypothetical protein